MDLQLNSAVVLVTGGASGIGLSIVKQFLHEGARVAILDRNAPAESSFLSHPSLLCLQVDLTDIQATQTAVAQSLSHFGRLDIIINNAGVNDSISLDDSPECFEVSLRKNLVHYFTIVSAAKQALIASPIGAIVNIGSKVSLTGQGQTSAYAAAKGGVNALTREWAVALAEHGIRVNTVIPAEVWTGMYERWLQSLEHPEAEKFAIEQSIPLGHRLTTPEEIAAMVVFLASPVSSHTTGQIICVDGGYTHLDRRYT